MGLGGRAAQGAGLACSTVSTLSPPARGGGPHMPPHVKLGLPGRSAAAPGRNHPPHLIPLPAMSAPYMRSSAFLRSSAALRMYKCTASDFQRPCALISARDMPAFAAAVAPPRRRLCEE
jgi:hypothetical protein